MIIPIPGQLSDVENILRSNGRSKKTFRWSERIVSSFKIMTVLFAVHHRSESKHKRHPVQFRLSTESANPTGKLK